MSQPNVSRFMEQLLDRVEVEWISLGSMANVGTGKSNRQDESENGAYPFYVRSKNILKSDTYQFDETAIVVPGEGGIGDIFHYVEGKYALHQRAYRINVSSEILSTKFLYHFMSSSFKQYILMKSVGATSISIRKPMLEGFQIPIPCPDNPEKSLAIQAEIVRILDAFTAMTAELTAELNLRQQQYNHYRDQLLSFDEGDVEWSCLNELTSRTSNIRWQETDETYQYIDLSSVIIENNSIAQTTEIDALSAPSRAQKLVQEHDVIFATTRPTQMRVCLISSDYNGAIASTGYCVLRAIQQKALPKWIYYCLTSTSFKYYLEENQSGSAYPAISDTKLKEFSIPVPSLEEQARIVAILDKFDTLANSITEGLPREIELRQQQYEYYRDLLLSFPKSDAEKIA